MADTLTAPPYQEEQLLSEPGAGHWSLAWRNFRHHRLGLLGFLIIVVFATVSILAPLISPYSFEEIDLPGKFAGPSLDHWLGTDELGRDTLTRLLYAGRVSLFVALSTTLLSSLVGVFVGATAGYKGGALEMVLMRLTDVMLSLPTLPLLLVLSKMLRDQIALQQLFGTSLTVVVMVCVLTLFGWMNVARLVHGSVLSLKDREYVEASRAIGASTVRIIVSHLVPNALTPIIVSATIGLGMRIIAEASLSFLGLGVALPTPSWGNMLTGVQSYMWRNPWLAFYPGACIFLIVLSFNFVGDALRDALDPRS